MGFIQGFVIDSIMALLYFSVRGAELEYLTNCWIIRSCHGFQIFTQVLNIAKQDIDFVVESTYLKL